MRFLLALIGAGLAGIVALLLYGAYFSMRGDPETATGWDLLVGLALFAFPVLVFLQNVKSLRLRPQERSEAGVGTPRREARSRGWEQGGYRVVVEGEWPGPLRLEWPEAATQEEGEELFYSLPSTFDAIRLLCLGRRPQDIEVMDGRRAYREIMHRGEGNRTYRRAVFAALKELAILPPQQREPLDLEEWEDVQEAVRTMSRAKDAHDFFLGSGLKVPEKYSPDYRAELEADLDGIIHARMAF